MESYSYRNTRLNTISNKLTYTFKVITVFEWTKEEFSEIAGKNHIESYKKVVAQVESGQGHSNIPLQKSIYWIGKKQGLLGSKLGYVTTGWVLSKETFKDFFDKFKTSHENRLDARILQNNDTNFNRLNMFLKKLRRLKNAMSCFSHRKNK